jgi:hypothetical protein
MRWAGGHRAGAAVALPAQGDSMWVGWRRVHWIAEDAVEPVHQSAKPCFRRLEHMFVRLIRGSDGMGVSQRVLQNAAGRWYVARRDEPNRRRA